MKASMNFQLQPVVVIEQLDLTRLADGISLKLADLYTLQALDSDYSDALWTCDDCGLQFGRLRSLKTHMKLHTAGCISCKLGRHLLTHSSERPLQRQYCDKSFPQGTIHGELASVECDECAAMCRDKKQLQQHDKMQRTGKEPCGCQNCRRSDLWFSSSKQLQKHKACRAVEKIGKARREKPGVCKICGKQFGSESKLIGHMRVHTGEKPYDCQFCGKTFRYDSAKQMHVAKMHTGLERTKCPQCSVHFFDSKRLKAHLLFSHGTERPFACQYCDQQFKRNYHRKIHELRHKGERNHRCTLCDKCFILPVDLQVHMRFHTQEKPYSCTQCHKRFSQKQHLNSHEKSHLGIKSISCNVCCKKFVEKSYLRVHMRIHTKEKPYKCHLCQKRFTFLSSFTTHCSRAHGKEENPCSCSECDKCFASLHGLSVHSHQHSGNGLYCCYVCDKRFSVPAKLRSHFAQH